MTRIRPADRGGHLCDDGRRCQCCVPSVARGAYGGATEESPLRRERYPYRGSGIPHIPEDYDKLDVEQRWATRGATVLRLPMVYGPHDPQRREDVVLRRLRAGRRRIPIGTGNLLWTRGHVEDLATGVLAALDNRAADGSTFNLGETLTWPISSWFDQIVTAAGADVELVRVPDHALPPDLALTAAPAQHLLVSTARVHRPRSSWTQLGSRRARRPSRALGALASGTPTRHPVDRRGHRSQRESSRPRVS